MQKQQVTPRDSQRISAGHALTLFVLGAVTGLLALLGRLTQELHSALLSRIPQPGQWFQPDGRSPLEPLLRDLDAASTRLMLACFALSTLMLLAGALLWTMTGHPATPRERIWTRFTTTIALLIGIAMCGACLIVTPDLRLIVIAVSGSLALIGLIVFVYLLFEFQFTAGAPPLPGDDSPG